MNLHESVLLPVPSCVLCGQMRSGDCGLHWPRPAYQRPPEGVTHTTTAGPGWPDLTGLLREVHAVPAAWRRLPDDLQRRITAALEGMVGMV